jgi:hypothetical protein
VRILKATWIYLGVKAAVAIVLVESATSLRHDELEDLDFKRDFGARKGLV